MKKPFYLLLVGSLFFTLILASKNSLETNNDTHEVFKNRHIFSLIMRYLTLHEQAIFSMTSQDMYTHGKIRVQYTLGSQPDVSPHSSSGHKFSTFVRTAILPSTSLPQVALRGFYRPPEDAIPIAIDLCFTVSVIIDPQDMDLTDVLGKAETWSTPQKKKALVDRFCFTSTHCTVKFLHSRGSLEDILAIFPCSPSSKPVHPQPIRIPLCVQIDNSLTGSIKPDFRYFALESIRWTAEASLILRYVDIRKYGKSQSKGGPSISFKMDITCADKPQPQLILTPVKFSGNEDYGLINVDFLGNQHYELIYELQGSDDNDTSSPQVLQQDSWCNIV